MTASDRIWQRAGRRAYAADRVRRAARPPVIVTPLGDDVEARIDVEVPVRDGTILRANVFLPRGAGPLPAIVSAHPYGKDAVPANTRDGRGLNVQYHLLRQPTPITFSDHTSWEAPDPAVWTGFGYAVVNLDVRGAGRSDGSGDLLSDQEADDIHDVVEWVAAQPWCDGGVGMLGVSYLAISQFKTAATRPPHLRAIVPWEGFTDAYRDLFTPGGVEERGFSLLWTNLVRQGMRQTHDFGAERAQHPVDDAWWRSLVPDLERIEVPMLVCGSFSDDNLHTRGSFRAFARAGSAERHLYTHRGGKWATFYGADAVAAQRAFLDRHLKGAATEVPVVRLEVRERGDVVAEVREENEWPLARTQWRTLALSADRRLVPPGDAASGSVRFRARRAAPEFRYRFAEDTEVTGPLSVRLRASVEGMDDASLFVGVSKWAGDRFIGFEGSYGFGRDLVTTGWQRLAFRTPLSGDPHVPDHDLSEPRLLAPGEIADVEVALGPSATLFRAGEELRLHVSGRPLSPVNPLFGSFPARYRPGPDGWITLHLGGPTPADLALPVIPRA
ncbi:CocE/NonD family hydrolase [Microbacterium sp. X-17]|uniref:CocE/NonD family hydrolase n=1 Tax=Microbacterium sp. X-17 TaxID=3144404 RepID=UPI0031F4B94F